MKQLSEHQLELQIPVVAWLLIVWNVIALVMATLVFVFMTSIGAAARDPEAAIILPIVGTLVPALMSLLTLPDFIAAFGLLTRKRWGRVLGIVVGILNLPGFPIGTLVGLYVLFVLMQDAADAYFEQTPRPVSSTAPVPRSAS